MNSKTKHIIIGIIIITLIIVCIFLLKNSSTNKTYNIGDTINLSNNITLCVNSIAESPNGTIANITVNNNSGRAINTFPLSINRNAFILKTNDSFISPNIKESMFATPNGEVVNTTGTISKSETEFKLSLIFNINYSKSNVLYINYDNTVLHVK